MTDFSSISVSPNTFRLNTSRPGPIRSVTSNDGTCISYLTIGNSGPVVIVIPGALSVAADYVVFASALAAHSAAQHFTVHILERRGRGLSGPQGKHYNITKECEDLLAVQDATDATFIVGHSYGGLVALEAARNNNALTKIAVYEPGVSIDGSIPMGWIPAYKKALAKQQYLDAFVEFVVGLGPERARQTPRWLMKLMLPLLMKPQDRQQKLSLLAENLREHEEVGRLDNSYPNYHEIIASALLLYGGKDELESTQLAMQQLSEVLPHSETKKFPRLDHFGIHEGAPQEVAGVIGDYFISNEKAG